MTTRALSPDQFGDPSTVPPEFGTQPIPAGMVRFHHYTQAPENLPSIKEHGLRESYARESYARGGTESPETFATAGTPSEDYKRSNYFVEGYADPGWKAEEGGLGIGRGSKPEDLEARRSTITFSGDVPAHQILATHQPWHENFRYIAQERPGAGAKAKPGGDPYATGSMSSQVARGEFDYLEKDPSFAKTYGPAVRATKIANAAATMLGGEL